MNLKNADSRKISRPDDNAGFSLIELIVAMLLFLMVSGTMWGLLQIGRVDRNRSSRRSDVLKNARIAVHLIGRDALNAGLGYHRKGAIVPDNFLSSRLGLPPDTNDERDLLTSIVAGDGLVTNNINPDPDVRTDIVAFSFREFDFNAGEIIALQNVSPIGGSSVPRVETEEPNGAQDAEQHDLYLIESDTSQIAVMATDVTDDRYIEAAPGDPLGFNQALDGSGNEGSVLRPCDGPDDENCTTYVATLKRFFLVRYRVNEDGTLVRTVYGNNSGAANEDQIQDIPIAYNVENLQIEYVLRDGSVTNNPTVGPDGVVGTDDDVPTNMNLVRQITVTINVRSGELDEQTQQPGLVSFTATFSTRNLEYDAG